MTPRKEMSGQAVSIGYAPAPVTTSKLPNAMRFPLLAILSLSFSSLLYTLAADFAVGELAGVSRSLNEWWEVLGLVGWRIVELGVGWYGGYDAAIYLPFRFLRPLSPTHNATAPKSAVANHSIINDLPVRIYTTLLAASIYSVVVYASYYTWLPVYLVVHFDGMRNISAAHSAAVPALLASFVPIGYAAREFIFTPSTGARMDRGDAIASAFNPATATLGETVWHNVWGYPKRTKVIIERTATLVVVSGLNTWLQTYVTIEGAEGSGAAGWSGVWAAAGALTGAVLWWVGDV
ncbi:MAG: hypothetical protein M1827_006806 [Pycnora praestabilis]|nr:MAG: hypothetical protein M1827_006806 [Pycnora praestabilis]